ncbi:ATPase [Arthrobacter sp. Sa2BUA2]|uniref:ATPase n=1 Tax=Arthrobacter pullicola TaxID=2762224 RepID=A0ABR8YI93_9MICC|nr:AAA family ATPase [Arthrobacter pullicola]MBD8043920.1 ATPase [Arthrobacter pullicola]
MTENLPDPERPETLSTRRGRRAAEARLAAQAEDQAPGGDEAGTAPASAQVAGASETVREHSVQDSKIRDDNDGDDDGSETAVLPAATGRRSRVALEPDNQAVLVGAGAGAAGAGASRTTESDTNISTKHHVPAEEAGSAQPSGEEPNESESGTQPGEPGWPPAPEARTYAWDGPEPATAGMSRIPLLSDLPASVFPAVLPQPPAEPPANSDELPLVDGPVPADDAAPAGGAEAPVEGGHGNPGAEVAVLPPVPAEMPADLRERTRLAVRGEPNDVRRATFLDTGTAKIPAARGFRGFLASMGLRIAPSAKELAERRDTRTVSQHWPGPRTISVVNGKGGANKTPTTVMLAALFARNGGGPVLAWDNNETRGTLGWRTEQAQHDSTVMDLLPETGLLLSPVAQSAMLARFVHHQTDDKYDVLRSNPNVLASEQKVTQADFDALHEVASKYFRLNIVDSGNDESAERWLRMIDHTDQLVIATTTVEEHAEAGALLLEALQERGGRSAELARGAVVIVSQADRNGTEAQARKVAEAFKVLARAAVTIPYDPALVKGQIRYASLRPATQRAWLKAAAAVAEGL